MSNMKYRIAAVAVAALLLQSCFSAKEYKRPEIATDNYYRTEQLLDSTSIASVSWTQIFTDPILQGHIEKGLANNYEVRIAMQNIEAAQAYLKQSKVGYLPSFNLGADWTHQELSKNSQFGAILQNRSIDQFQFTGNLSWEADIWGKIRSNKRAANADYLRTVAAQQAVKTQLISDIASLYYQLMALDQQLQVVDTTLGNRNKSVEVIRALKDAGNVNEVGVKQTEAQLYATQLIREDLLTQIVLLENTFSILLGQAPQQVARGSFNDQQLPSAIDPGIPALALRNRPDVIAAEYNLISQFEMTNVARSAFYPSLTINATGGFQSVELKEWFSANSLFANVVSGLVQPVFNRRQIRTRYEVAKANQEAALLQFERSLLIAGKEVSDALQQYKNETGKLDIRARQVDALQKAAGYSDELLNYGMVNYFEVLTAKDQALNTELNLIDNRFRQYNALITLYRALGGGWQ
jgi:multidrug efflux system outer membrane protein